MPYKCEDCGAVTDKPGCAFSDMDPVELHGRLLPGDVVPAGTCAGCGAFCHEIASDPSRVKTAVVSSRDIDSSCLLPKRFTGGCHECSRVRSCKLEQAAEGLETRSRNLMLKAEHTLREYKRKGV